MWGWEKLFSTSTKVDGHMKALGSALLSRAFALR